MSGASKKSLTQKENREEDVDEAFAGAGWDADGRVGGEVPNTKVQVLVRGRMVTRGESRRADYAGPRS